MSWYDVYNRILSNGWRKQVMDFVKKQPNMPEPDGIEGEYAPSLSWSGGLRLSRDYLDFEVYEIFRAATWRRVTEDEFFVHMRSQYGLL